MKKIVSLLVLTMFVVSLGAVSYQKTYLKDSVEWKAAEAIAIAAGYNPPTAVNPATGGEILNAIERIDYNALSDEEKAFYDMTAASLGWNPTIESGIFGMTPSVVIAPEYYKQTEVVERYGDYLFPVRDRLNCLTFGFEYDYADTFYGYTDYLMLSPNHAKQYDELSGFNFDTILEGFNTQHEGTLRAGALIGNDWMNFSVQRSRQSMGYGKTSTFAIGDNFSRQDFMRLHTFSDIFDYTMNISLYSQQDKNNNTIDFNFNGLHNMTSFHRFDVKPAKNVSFSITEGIVAYMDTTLDMRLLNPFLFHHGFNNYNEQIEVDPLKDTDEANNMFFIEAGWTVIPHLRVRAEIAIDQIQLAGEAADANARPNANGFMVGVDTSWIFDDMFLTAYAEYASTSPYLYLNYKTTNSEFQPNYDYVLGVHDWWGVDEVAYGGFRFGGDSVVYGFGASFGKLDSFLVDASFAYSKHGLYGLGYANGLKNEFGPEHVGDKNLNCAEDQIEHRIELKIDGNYSITDFLDVSAGIGLVNIKNYKNQPGEKFSDFQMKLGVALDVTQIFR